MNLIIEIIGYIPFLSDYYTHLLVLRKEKLARKWLWGILEFALEYMAKGAFDMAITEKNIIQRLFELKKSESVGKE